MYFPSESGQPCFEGLPFYFGPGIFNIGAKTSKPNKTVLNRLQLIPQFHNLPILLTPHLLLLHRLLKLLKVIRGIRITPHPALLGRHLHTDAHHLLPQLLHILLQLRAILQYVRELVGKDQLQVEPYDAVDLFGEFSQQVAGLQGFEGLWLEG